MGAGALKLCFPAQRCAAIVCTSCSRFAGVSAGVCLEEVAAPYYLFNDAHFQVEIISVKGGQVPLDSGAAVSNGEFARRFESDTVAMQKLRSTKALSAVASQLLAMMSFGWQVEVVHVETCLMTRCSSLSLRDCMKLARSLLR
mmetsp:Transcript_55073/g.131243  ORF Transcript_55073/g.131243 Transcript_55073/m.131243 type:complete len:143 (-) Transcript_55073:400-828(-)